MLTRLDSVADPKLLLLILRLFGVTFLPSPSVVGNSDKLFPCTFEQLIVRE